MSDLQNWQGQTLLHFLGGGAQTEKNRVKCAAMLLDADASTSARDDDYRSTALGWAARNGVKDMVEVLLARGAATNSAGDEALGHAALVGGAAGASRDRGEAAESRLERSFSWTTRLLVDLPIVPTW